MQSEDFEATDGAEDIKDLEGIRGPLGREFEPRAAIKEGLMAESEMVLPFLFSIQTFNSNHQSLEATIIEHL